MSVLDLLVFLPLAAAVLLAALPRLPYTASRAVLVAVTGFELLLALGLCWATSRAEE